MSTTTGADLLARADRLARDLVHCPLPTDAAAWQSFDTTVYRLLRELVGPARTDSGACSRTRSALLQVLHAYPTPLRPPLDTVLSARQAARFVEGEQTEIQRLIRDGELTATRHENQLRIESNALDRRPDIAAADAGNPHPLARLATTLGLLADMISAERQRPRAALLANDQQIKATAIRVLSHAAVAARYSMSHGPIEAGDRPLAIAQYAQRSVDALGCPGSLRALDRLTASIATADTSLNERLDSALHRWAQAAHGELQRTIPASEVLRNIANQGAHIYAVTHRLLSVDASAVSTPDKQHVMQALRDGVEALRAADDAWKIVTTLQPQGHDYFAASRRLFKALHAIGTVDLAVATRPACLDVQAAVASLARGHRDLATFVGHSADIARACLNSGLLFAPAKALPSSLTHLRDQRLGRYVAMTEAEGGRICDVTRQAFAATSLLEHEFGHLMAMVIAPGHEGLHVR